MDKSLQDDLKAPEDMVLTRLLELNAVIYGVVLGLIAGVGLFGITLWLVVKGGEVVGPHLALLGQYLPGYTVTVSGSFIGLGYGFAIGFVLAYTVARIYNWLVKLKGTGATNDKLPTRSSTQAGKSN